MWSALASCHFAQPWALCRVLGVQDCTLTVFACSADSPQLGLQVDDRLNGDGVGYALGVSDPVLGWVIGGVASLIWILYFIAQKDFGDFEDKDSGVGL